MKITIGDGLQPHEKIQLEKSRSSALKRSRNYSNFIESYVEYASGQESTNKIRRWVAISILAAAIGRKTWLDAGYFKIFPNFYILIIGESGVIRKSSTTKLGVELLEELEDINLMSQRVTDRSLIDQMHEARGEFTYDGKTYVQSSVYCYASELIVFMREVSGPISELLTDFWDCPLKWTYKNKDTEICLEAPCLNMLGASTPTWLQKAIPAEELEGGLSSRIIFVHEPEGPDILIPWPESSLKLKDMKKRLISDLKQIASVTGPFTYTQEAKDFYSEWYRDQKRKIKEIPDIRLRGFYARKPITIWKLAMVLSLSENCSRTFDKHHLVVAIKLMEEIEETLLGAFGSSGKNKLAQGMDQIKAILQLRKKMTHKEIMTILFKDYNGGEVEQLMKDLRTIDGIKLSGQNNTLTYIYEEEENGL